MRVAFFFPLVTVLSLGSLQAQETAPEGPFRPGLTITVRGGLQSARANSPMFDVMTGLLTLEKSDFRTPSFGIELGAWVGDRAEVLMGMDAGNASMSSEFRSRVGTSDPVLQETQYSAGPDIYLGAKVYLFAKGHMNPETGWEHRRWNVFAGAGGGQSHYRLQQSGEFIDSEDETIVFPATYRSRGGSPYGYVAVGTDVTVYGRAGIVLEARQQWGKAPHTKAGFHDNLGQFDVSGTRVTAGIRVYF